MATWKLTLEYDGTRYSGWQEQKNARTIQGELRQACEELFGCKVDLQGAGRTDAGVHAAAQVAHLKVKGKKLPPEVILRELNDRLPASIAILRVEPAPEGFHARHDAKSRTYVYQLATRKSAFSKKYVWWIKQPLDVELMQKAAAQLVGRHDFRAFCAEDPSRPGESTVVVVDHAEFTVEEGMIQFRIVASHYLWRMVRRLVGALVKLGLHEICLEDFEQLLQGRSTERLNVAQWTAPAAGLFLAEVEY
ncbi:MAG: tRNA pseudouridine(38-40) synthase TruA [Bryobacteraceae bacterium]|nr:tRNA pseudouridine(38-40) synthase TruA [Bryobacteraceae bacterium]MDW8377262.1 tRNA pseudouridine(38-40) synthase TruA [Bryobacterales bacterium]